MTYLRDKLKSIIRGALTDQQSGVTDAGQPAYALGTCTAVNDDGTVLVQDKNGNVSTAFPKYPTVQGQVVMIVNDGKGTISAVPIGQNTKIPDVIHPPYFTGGGQAIRFAVIQTVPGALPLPPVIITQGIGMNQRALAVDFQDYGSDDVYRLTFPDLDYTWMLAPGDFGGEYSTNTSPQANQIYTLPQQMNNTIALTKPLAFSPDGQVVAIAFTNFTFNWFLAQQQSILSLQDTYHYKIRLYKIGTTMKAVGDPLYAISPNANLYKLKATLAAEFNQPVFGYGLINTVDPLEYIDGRPECGIYPQYLMPISLLVQYGGGPGGYTTYWLDCYQGGPAAAALSRGGWVDYSLIPSGGSTMGVAPLNQCPTPQPAYAWTAPYLDPNLLPPSMLPVPTPTTVLWIYQKYPEGIPPPTTCFYAFANTTVVEPQALMCYLNKMVVGQGGAITSQRLVNWLISALGGVTTQPAGPPGSGIANPLMVTRQWPIDLINVDEKNGHYLVLAVVNSAGEDMTNEDDGNNMNVCISNANFAVLDLAGLQDPIWQTFQGGGCGSINTLAGAGNPSFPGINVPASYVRPTQLAPRTVWSDPTSFVNGTVGSGIGLGYANLGMNQNCLTLSTNGWSIIKYFYVAGLPVLTVIFGDLLAANVQVIPMTVNPVLLPFANPTYNPNPGNTLPPFNWAIYFKNPTQTSGLWQSMWTTTGPLQNTGIPNYDRLFPAMVNTDNFGVKSISVTATPIHIGKDNTLPTYNDVTPATWLEQLPFTGQTRYSVIFFPITAFIDSRKTGIIK